MPIIYALPFMFVSAICCFICIVIRELRPYIFQASVAPVAFGFCSIVVAGAIVLVSDFMGLSHYVSLDEPISGAKGFLIVIVIYVIPGLAGAWLAVFLAGRVKTRLFG